MLIRSGKIYGNISDPSELLIRLSNEQIRIAGQGNYLATGSAGERP